MNASARDQFSHDWLRLREPADHRARASTLVPLCQQWLSTLPHAPLQVVDFGSGRGSNVQYLAPQLACEQHWTLLDHDHILLAQAQARGLPEEVSQLVVQQVDLRQPDAWQPYCEGVQLMTASALIDIVSEAWLSQWVHWGAAQQSAFWLALSVDGTWRCSPDHPDDAWVQALFNAHQQAQGAFGVSLGPRATEILATQLRQQHYDVTLEASPWQLLPSEHALQTQLLMGWAQAAIEQSPSDQTRIEQWQQHRQQWIAQGVSSLQVGHHDLLAVPR